MVSPMMAALEATYEPAHRWLAVIPHMEELLTIEPPPFLIISGTAYFMPRKTLLRLTVMQRSQLSSDSSAVRPVVPMPALLNSMSSLP